MRTSIAVLVLGILAPALAVGDSKAPAPLREHGKRLERVYEAVDLSTVSPHVDMNVIFLNRCAGGCSVRCSQQTNSSTNGSSVCGGGTKTLTQFKAGDAVWGQVVQCVREVFAPFGVQITETDPGTARHFEIMIAGNDSDLGLSGVGGISPFNCSVSYIPNSLVFVFSDTYGSDVDELCAVAAQEIAHSWRMDHVTEPSDPLTYFPFAGRRHFVDRAVQCGSDCIGGQSPFGSTCTGANQQNHACECTGQQTQNSVALIKGLFGDGTPTPPSVSIMRPKNGDQVVPGFPVNTEATDDIGLKRVELYIDDVLISTLEDGPYAFNAPATLADGTHRIEVIAYDISETSATAVATVFIGAPCMKPADCSTTTDTCIGGRCVPGSGVQGGLGSPCANNLACASGLCVNGDVGMRCSDTCDIAAEVDECPSGFLCLEAGSLGVCYPGEEDTGGCASSGGSPVGPIFLGLVFGGLLVRRRRT